MCLFGRVDVQRGRRRLCAVSTTNGHGVGHQRDGHGGGMTVMVVDVYVCVRSFHKFEAQRKSLFYWYMATRELAVEKPACQA